MTPLPRRSRLTTLVVTAAAATTVLLPAFAAPAGAATPGHAKRVVSGDFPDPGFAKFGSRYYLYKTGGLFGSTSSTSPAKGYGKVVSSMKSKPKWVAKDAKLWAPDVFATKDGLGRALYVMYYTGVYAKTGVHCIGVAKSGSPNRGFVDSNSKPTVCSGKAGYEAIDPSAYRAKDGKRYMLYKVNYQNRYGFDIRAVPMDPSTGSVTVGASKSKITSSSRIEAPSAIAHGGKVWLFTSRGDYINCTYSTDVWSAPTFWGGKFTRVKTVMSRASTGLCGPGGATVLQDGKTTRIAFHAYVDANHNGVKDGNTRQAWVGELRWNSSGPYLY